MDEQFEEFIAKMRSELDENAKKATKKIIMQKVMEAFVAIGVIGGGIMLVRYLEGKFPDAPTNE